MRLQAFAVFDEKVGAFMAPFFCLTKGQAARSFGDAVLDSQNPMSRHPEDYRLYEVGSFDDQEGVFEVSARNLVARGSEFVPAAPALRQVQ